MKRKAQYVLAAALLLPTLGAHPVFAKGPAVTVTGFKADLNPATVGGKGEGEAQYKLRSSVQGTSESFEAEVEFPIPDASVGITDLVTAQNALFELHLFHGASEYAVCTLPITEIEFKYKPTGVQVEAEYGVSVSQQTPTSGTPVLSEKVGTCTLGAVPGVPTVAANDTAVVVLSGTSTPILTGVFQ